MNWKTITIMVLALALAAGGIYFVSGMGNDSGKTTPGRSGDDQSRLLLYSGAGMRPAVEKLTREFERKHGINVEVNYAGSGQLLGSISSHQRGDVFMPGAEKYADSAIESGLAVPETKKTAAYFIPVILVQKGNPKHIKGLSDLTREGLRLGLGDERACAIGAKTVEIFKKNDISLDDVQPQVIYKSNTVNELCVAVQMGSVDATIVWDTNARHFSNHGDIVHIPLEKNLDSTIPLVMLESTEMPERSKKFIEFATSGQGRDIWKSQDYTVSLDGDEDK